MKLILILIAFMSATLVKAQPTSSDVWINEFHYDGVTTFGQSDQNEFIELVIKTSIVDNPVEFAKYSLVLYTVGALDNVILTPGRALPYNLVSPLYTAAQTVHPLNGFTACASGSAGFTMLSKAMPILLDLPGAMAIVYDNTTIVQLLSYEKSFKISPLGGAAAGLTTTLILTSAAEPADETALSTTNHAVSLTGTANTYSGFTWDDNAARTATPCAVNNGQTLLSGVLAVHWIDFRVKAVQNDIYLQWEMGDESNTIRYEVEMRSAGVFNKVATVQKDISFNGKYNHRLSQVPDGIYQLRIKAIEADGSYSYSDIRQVKIGSKFGGDITVYPNPAVSGRSVMVQLIPQQRNGYMLSVIDATGRTVLQQKINGFEPGRINTVSIPLQNLPAGIYRIKLVSETENHNTGLVITE